MQQNDSTGIGYISQLKGHGLIACKMPPRLINTPAAVTATQKDPSAATFGWSEPVSHRPCNYLGPAHMGARGSRSRSRVSVYLSLSTALCHSLSAQLHFAFALQQHGACPSPPSAHPRATSLLSSLYLRPPLLLYLPPTPLLSSSFLPSHFPFPRLLLAPERMESHRNTGATF